MSKMVFLKEEFTKRDDKGKDLIQQEVDVHYLISGADSKLLLTVIIWLIWIYVKSF